MTEQEIRQIVKEEIVTAFEELYGIADEYVALRDGWGNIHGTMPKYSRNQCFAELARRLSTEVEDNE